MIDIIDKFSPRFIHMPNLPCSYKDHGATVAYIRNTSHVFFAWSQVSPGDKYNKNIGRHVSAERLEKYLVPLKALTQVREIPKFIQTEGNFIGFISAAELVYKNSYVNMAIADHALATLTPMDFKHNHIISCLADLILEQIE